MQNSTINRVFESAWTRSQLEQRYLAIDSESVHQFQELLSHMLYPNPRLRPSSERLSRNELGQPGLWSMGISGDLPILCILAQDERALLLVREVLVAHTYWRLQGFKADIVIANQEAASYDNPLKTSLLGIVQAHSLHTGIDVPGGSFLLDWKTLSEPQQNLLLAAARVVLVSSRGRLGRQLAAITDPVSAPAVAKDALPSLRRYEPSNLPFLELDYFNGLGGFSRQALEYCVYLDAKHSTPRPWANVIASPEFGTLLTESGLGFTWSGNSQSNRLTPWRNDPVSDPPSEALYLRDEDTGEFWSPTAQPARDADPYRARHGMGYSVFEHNHNGIEQELSVFVPHTELDAPPLKVCLLRLINRSATARRISVTHYVEWVLGSSREESQMNIRTSLDAPSQSLIAQNLWNTTHASRCAFQALSPRPVTFSADRTGFLGRLGSYHSPQAMAQPALDSRLGAGLDPCGALQTTVTLQPGDTRYVVCMLGQTSTLEEARALVSRFSQETVARESLAATAAYWKSQVTTIEVNTPIHSVNLLMNGWLNYQSLSCRFWGRSGYYQSGGAFGFRDQLQDCMSLAYFAPSLTREHILRCASRQYEEGDVQHWWHADTGMGVRTTCSDDLLWLPYVTAHYVALTGDKSVLNESIPFLTGPALKEGETEHLHTPETSLFSATLLDHCLRALRHSEPLGAHSLPLMGNGDWNDGMNLVGHAGRGESVWLAWFLIVILRDFAALLRNIGREDAAPALDARRTKLLAAVEEHCWDGDWYLRAFFDDGSPLGSHANPEASIDSIAQSWSVMAGATPARSKAAIQSALEKLVDNDRGLVHLFWPPFDHSLPHPGYIMGYPPGLRENGGQYTHGSLWLAQACALQGDGANAVRLLQIMNPIESARDTRNATLYGGEPYVVSADVYAAPGQEGRSGWSWYTGSASWMYRIWLESVLGFRLRGDTLSFHPVVPDSWSEFKITYRHFQSRYEIQFRRATASDPARVMLDGQPCPAEVSLSRQPGEHRLEVYF